MATDVVIGNIQCFTDTSDITELVYRLTKQEIFDIIHPVNEIYTQYPLMPDPQTLYNTNGITSTWVEVNFSGAFFRSEGGKANSFISSGTLNKQSSQTIKHKHTFPHTHDITHYHTPGDMEITGHTGYGGSNQSAQSLITGAFAYTGSFGTQLDVNDDPAGFPKGDFYASRSWTGSTSDSSKTNTDSKSVDTSYDGNASIQEARPENLTIKIWRRTS